MKVNRVISVNKKKIHTEMAFLSHSGIALFFGQLYYIVRRPDARITKILNSLFELDALALGYEQVASNIFDWYLADFLWAYALTFTLNLVALVFSLDYRRIFVICLITDCIMEILQGLRIFSGTFDMADIVVQIGATLIAQSIIQIYLKKEG